MAKVLVEDKYGNRWYRKVIKKNHEPTFIISENDKELSNEGITMNEFVKRKIVPTSEPDTEVEAPAITIIEEPIQKVIESNPIIEPVKQVEKVKRSHKKKVMENKKIFDIHDIPLPVIKIASVFISCIAIIRSFGYIYSYFSRVDTAFFAILMALMLVLVSFISPQVFLISIRQKKYFVTLLATIIFGVFMYTNIWVTVSGLTYARTQSDYYVSAGQENIVKAKRRLEELKTKETRIMEDKLKDGKEYDTLLVEFDRMTLEGLIGTYNYNTTRNRLADAKKRYDSDKSALDLIDKERVELNKVEGIDSVIIKTEDTKKEESKIDLIFAVALDLSGPVFMAFSLFL